MIMGLCIAAYDIDVQREKKIQLAGNQPNRYKDEFNSTNFR